MTGKTTGGHKSAGILDDYAVRKVVATKEGTITRTPTADIDIANKAYCDSIGFPKLNEVENPDGNKNFTMANSLLKFTYTAPTPAGEFGGAFEIEGKGGFNGDLVHIHQHTGNVGATELLVIESEDSDAMPLRLTANADADIALKVTVGKIQDKTGYVQPIGAITMYGGAAAPSGYVLCDGASLLRAGTYAELFAAIGVTFGTADGTHFNVPDMRGIFPRGAGTNGTLDDANGAAFAATYGEYQNDTFQGHRHSQSAGNAGWPIPTGAAHDWAGWDTGVNWVSNSAVLDPTTDTAHGVPRTSTETRPANLVLTFIIKY